MARSIIFLFSTLFLISCGKDPSFNKLIVGTWSTMDIKDKNFVYVESSYFEDGTKCTMFVDYSTETPAVTHATGGWEIEGNKLRLWTTRSTDKFIKADDVIEDEIISIDNNIMKLRPLGYAEDVVLSRYRVLEERGRVHCLSDS